MPSVMRALVNTPGLPKKWQYQTFVADVFVVVVVVVVVVAVGAIII